eukprot:PhM_4_TR1369/c0_g2_i1/m.29033
MKEIRRNIWLFLCICLANITSVLLQFSAINHLYGGLHDIGVQVSDAAFSVVALPALLSGVSLWFVAALVALLSKNVRAMVKAFAVVSLSHTAVIVLIGILDAVSGILFTYPLPDVPESVQLVLGAPMVIPMIAMARRLLWRQTDNTGKSDNNNNNRSGLALLVRRHYYILVLAGAAAGSVLALTPEFRVTLSGHWAPIAWYLLSTVLMLMYSVITAWVLHRQDVARLGPLLSLTSVLLGNFTVQIIALALLSWVDLAWALGSARTIHDTWSNILSTSTAILSHEATALPLGLFVIGFVLNQATAGLLNCISVPFTTVLGLMCMPVSHIARYAIPGYAHQHNDGSNASPTTVAKFTTTVLAILCYVGAVGVCVVCENILDDVSETTVECDDGDEEDESEDVDSTFLGVSHA